MITERDYYNIINTARKTGKTEGMSAGMRQGLQKGLQQGLRQGMENGLKKGREEGRKEGLLEGQSKERINTAKSMKAMNMDADIIAKATGLSESEIAAL